ncbi:MAG: tRNA (adenosine(37)-N6)-threonylcarbamoyltransferase complex ATPase subunit type 1 TsaE [Phycisphaeraceae bacterium]|nr:tRNA (adenosine(37)-N6)-threonylcarbamoyltransferase complex ATPase subunit type 1 TsaE [Phycisphaeraceae bacterium]
MTTRPPTDPSPDWQGRTTSVDATQVLARVIARHVRAGDLIALEGQLGAGKTQWVRGLAAGLGANPGAVSSPTFVMVQEYDLAPLPATAGGGSPRVLVHIDAYRLRTLEDLESTGWDPSTLEPGGELRRQAVVVVEWADRLGELLGKDYLALEFSHTQEDDARDVRLWAVGDWRSRLPKVLSDLQASASEPHEPSHACPICGQPAAPIDRNAHFPFCSPRCRMADLNRWLTGHYKISRPVEAADLEDDDSSR